MSCGFEVVVFALCSALIALAVVFGIVVVTGLAVAFGLNHVSPIQACPSTKSVLLFPCEGLEGISDNALSRLPHNCLPVVFQLVNWNRTICVERCEECSPQPFVDSDKISFVVHCPSVCVASSHHLWSVWSHSCWCYHCYLFVLYCFNSQLHSLRHCCFPPPDLEQAVPVPQRAVERLLVLPLWCVTVEVDLKSLVCQP